MALVLCVPTHRVIVSTAGKDLKFLVFSELVVLKYPHRQYCQQDLGGSSLRNKGRHQVTAYIGLHTFLVDIIYTIVC